MISQDSGKLSNLLGNIKGAYEEFVQSMTDQKSKDAQPV